MKSVVTLACMLALAAGLAASSAAAGPAAGPPGGKSKAATDGERLFATVCGLCHHKGGRKAGKGPRLAGSKRSDAFLFRRIQRGKLGRMPAFGRMFSEDQIRAIVAYIRSLDTGGK